MHYALMNVTIEASWKEKLADEFKKPYFEKLGDFVRNAYRSGPVYPPPSLAFNAFAQTPFDTVRVVILGQDPYHSRGQAHGLSFSVPDGILLPPSLQNIYREIQSDLGILIEANGNLERWAKQGVFLLNATLTVAAGRPLSHHGKGWEQFTNSVIRKLSTDREHLVFLLWGRLAMEKGKDIDVEKHLVLTAAHPSPLSAHSGFFGCRHFSKANEYLIHHGFRPVEWA